MKKYLLIFAATLGMLAASCSKSNEWTVDGQIQGADGQTRVIEASNNGQWYPLDSIELDASGKFSYSHAAAGFPDIYRLRLGEKTLYFPIDSIETVSIISNASAFDSEYTLAGSQEAETMMQVDRQLREVVARGGAAAIADDSILKRNLGQIMLGDLDGIVSYYIISKKVGGVPLFDPANKSDIRMIGAVANAFTQFRPNDPRTNYLKSLYINNRQFSPATPRDTLFANEVPIFDIKLYDEVGKEHSLKNVAGGKKVVLLNFNVYTTDESLALNRELNTLYNKYKDAGFEIFQVNVDEDEYAWKQSARNIPWITVYNSKVDGARNLQNYNVQYLPTSFIIHNGEIVERIDTPSETARVVAKYF